MNRLIAFSGLKGSGKDTAAMPLLGLGYQNAKFADPIKAMARAYFRTLGAPEDEIDRLVDGDLKEVPTEYLFGKTSRLLQQVVGTEAGRDGVDPDIWVKALALRASKGAKIVCTDLRFPNEVDYIRQAGGVSIRIERPGLNQNEFSLHASEIHIPTLDVDRVIINDGTIEDLHRDVIWTLSKLEEDAIDRNR